MWAWHPQRFCGALRAPSLQIPPSNNPRSATASSRGWPPSSLETVDYIEHWHYGLIPSIILLAPTGCNLQTLRWGLRRMVDIGTATPHPTHSTPPTPLPLHRSPPCPQDIMMANVPGSEQCVAYLHTCMHNSGTQISIKTSMTDSLSLPVVTHRPVSISAHHSNQYLGENPP